MSLVKLPILYQKGLTPVLLKIVNPHPLDEDCSYLSRLSGPVLKEAMEKLSRYTQHVSAALGLGAIGHWEAFQTNQHHDEQKCMEDSIQDIKLQWNRYLHEAKESITSFSRVNNTFLTLKLTGSLFDQVAQLVRTMEMKYQALAFVLGRQEAAHKEINFLHSQNDLLTQQLIDCMSSTLKVILLSFENDLDQVEYFHYPFKLSREKIRSDQAAVGGKTIFIRKQA